MKKITFILLMTSCTFAHGQNELTISGKVIDCQTKTPLKGIPVHVMTAHASIKVVSDDKGNYIAKLKPLAEDKLYMAFCNSIDNYSSISSYESQKSKMPFTDKSKTVYIADFCLNKLKSKPIHLIFPEVSFKEGKTEIPEENKSAIAKIVEILKTYPDVKIVLLADSRSESEDVICGKRLEAVKNNLINLGISKDRIGQESRPADPTSDFSRFNIVSIAEVMK